MVNLLPAVILGGPPHAGKSVLFYSLTMALRERKITHHAIRVCPDGEGNWSQEISPDLVQEIRVKGQWTDQFVNQVNLDLAHRLLPMLVDMGGWPKGEQIGLLKQATHSIFLFREDKPDSTEHWLNLAEASGLLPLARLTSKLQGSAHLLTTEPIITGTITGLERSTQVSGPLFETLVDRIAALFQSYSQADLDQMYLALAPTDLVISLGPLLQSLAPNTNRWHPSLLPALMDYIPASTPLSVYGRGPHWLYAALAAHAYPQPFYQFDPRFPKRNDNPGWLTPPSLQIHSHTHKEVTTHLISELNYVKLSIDIVKKHLEYTQSDQLPFPPLPPDQGLVLYGIMPSWLATALVRLYITESSKMVSVPWIAYYQPQLQGAVVVFSQSSEYPLGKVVAVSGNN